MGLRPSLTNVSFQVEPTLFPLDLVPPQFPLERVVPPQFPLDLVLVWADRSRPVWVDKQPARFPVCSPGESPRVVSLDLVVSVGPASPVFLVRTASMVLASPVVARTTSMELASQAVARRISPAPETQVAARTISMELASPLEDTRSQTTGDKLRTTKASSACKPPVTPNPRGS